jgi:cytochrome oxidase Cu insertion factor (SCO1/SenC/PrrC family)
MNETKKMLFVNLTNMAFYDGPEENISGGGRFVDANGFGHELFNFRNDNGHCYGYATPWGKVKLLYMIFMIIG